MSLYKVISFKALCEYEKQTGKKALDVLKRASDMSFIDLRDLYFLFKYTKDNSVTLEKIENLTDEEIASLEKDIHKAQAALSAEANKIEEKL